MMKKLLLSKSLFSIIHLQKELNVTSTLFCFVLLFVSSFADAANFTSRTSGNWNAATTWTRTSGTDADGIPDADDIVYISGGYTINLTGNESCSALSFPDDNNNNNTLNLNGYTLDVLGVITIPRADSGDLNLINVGSGILNAASIAFPTSGNTMRHKIIISTGVVNVSGDISTSGNNTSATIEFTGTGSLKVGGSFFYTQSPVTAGGSLIAGSGTIELNGVNQYIRQFNYNNLVLSGSGTKVTTGTTTISSTLTIRSGVNVNLGSQTHTASFLVLGNTQAIGGSWGSTSSTATYKTNVYFTSTSGRINVSTTCSGFSGVTPITNVQFNTLNKTTSASSTVAYEDYTGDTPTIVSKTQYYAITVKGNTGSDVNVWYTAFIDWNNDGDFDDSGEYFVVGTIRNSSGTDSKVTSVYIQIPTSATIGNVRMRIIGRTGSYSTSSCVTTGTGQMEDYLITIQDACTGSAAAGNTLTSVNPVCAGAPVALTLQNQSAISKAATYVWENSTDGGATWLPATPVTNDFFFSNFSTQPTNTNLYGSASISGGELVLTTALNDLKGGYVIQSTPGRNIDSFTVNFDYAISGGTSADGFSLSYASNITNNDGGGESGEGSGIIIQFDTYDNENVATGSRVRVLYNGIQLFATAINAPFNLRTATNRNVNLNVDSKGLLSLTIANTVVIANLQLPAAYLSEIKSLWKFKLSARTGGSNDRHIVDNLSIKYLDVNNTGSTFTTSQTVATNYRVKVTCGGATTISTPILVDMPTAPTVGAITQITCSSSTGSIAFTGLPSSWTLNQTGTTTATIPGTTATYTVLNLLPGTYKFTLTNGTCTSGATNNISIIDQSSTTYNGTWSNGLPDATKNVTFASAFPITADLSACACTVNSGVAMTVPSGRTLNITNALTVLGTGSLTFNDDASLVQDQNTTINSNSGNISFKRDTAPVRRKDYTYWSSPVSNFTLNQLSSGTYFDKYYRWNPNTGWIAINYGVDPMIKGVGYIVRAPESHSLTAATIYNANFIGVPNNGDVNVTPVGGKWNLIGNPYPSALDAVKFIQANTISGNETIIGAVYFWTHNTPPANTDPAQVNRYFYTSDDYAVLNLSGTVVAREAAESEPDKTKNIPTGNIASGQGFFVRALTNNDIKFTNKMRLAGADNSQFFKTVGSVEKDRLWLNFKNTEGAFKQLLVAYVDGATDSWDNNYDATTYSASPYVDFYSVNETKKLTIQGRALPFVNADQVPLGYKSTIVGNFTISIDHTEGLFNEQAIYLEDKTNGTIHDLRTSDYTFTTQVGTFTDRFVLRYTNKTLGTGDFENIEDGILVSVKNKAISIVSSKETIKEVSIFDITGKTLYNKTKVSNTELQVQNLQSSNQVLLVKVTLDNDFKTTRKIIFQ
jgi:hypothetical protein